MQEEGIFGDLAANMVIETKGAPKMSEDFSEILI
jgi:hypothetical protein